MANPEHVELLKRGARALAEWKTLHPHAQLELQDARVEWSLRGMDLSGADLRGANLTGVEFNGADLTRADLRRANLRAAMLGPKTLLHGTDLVGTDLKEALCGHAIFADVDL